MLGVHLKWYPDQSLGMFRRLVVDLVVAAWVLLWAAFGFLVYEAVLALQVIASGISDTGHTFNKWIGAFRSITPEGIPGISDFLNGAAGALQRYSGDALISTGSQVHNAVFHLAVLMGLLTALPPILLALVYYVPGRWREAREMGSAMAFVRVAQLTGNVEQARALLAYRAVSSLSFRDLMRASGDPVGDLAAHDYDRLAAAMMRRAGLEPYRLPGPRRTELPATDGDQARLGRPRAR